MNDTDQSTIACEYESSYIDDTELTFRPGQLGINSHVIHDTREYMTIQRSIGHEVVPSLFLPVKTEREILRRSHQARELVELRDKLFVYETSALSLSTESVRESLFVEQPLQPMRLISDSMSESTQPLPVWSNGIFIVIWLLILGCISIQIGKRLARKKLRKVDI